MHHVRKQWDYASNQSHMSFKPDAKIASQVRFYASSCRRRQRRMQRCGTARPSFHPDYNQSRIGIAGRNIGAHPATACVRTGVKAVRRALWRRFPVAKPATSNHKTSDQAAAVYSIRIQTSIGMLRAEKLRLSRLKRASLHFSSPLRAGSTADIPTRAAIVS